MAATSSNTESPHPDLESRFAAAALRGALAWYFDRVYGRLEGPGVLPFYCDPNRVGHFAVRPSALAAGDPTALFRLFVALTMFQARRDVVIMRQQASMSREHSQYLLSPAVIGRQALRAHCDLFDSAERFDSACAVEKHGSLVDCAYRPGAPCHVKDATVLLNRMGDMGKLPTSAWLHAWKGGRLKRLLRQVIAAEPDPQQRAARLVEHFAQIYRVGVKLATMFVWEVPARNLVGAVRLGKNDDFVLPKAVLRRWLASGDGLWDGSHPHAEARRPSSRYARRRC